jgi:hypothetical protein
MASKPVKLQRPDEGHRVQSLLTRVVGTCPPALLEIKIIGRWFDKNRGIY